MGVPRAAEAWGAAAWTAGVRLGGSGSRGLWAYRGLQPGGGSELGGLWTWGGGSTWGLSGASCGQRQEPTDAACHQEMAPKQHLPS